ncbi:uncharacterized protein LOC118464772 [Anopheles albimanus]|uniref:uncharacterized protein LOC118464772 n=1 Tax=Anopheles albimanus TaxID=7167 RepID=UPI0016404F5B|nr:uncharacterized protein LOC118464772 [Anopheles albimanus]XP_035788294.1 uncharacterized protein LOC118464772 [Anopheles albimanus]
MPFKTYSVFRPLAVFAGIFGIFQSLIWIGFAITGIIAYYCEIGFGNQSDTLGSLLTVTFFKVYFRGTCEQPDVPSFDTTLVDQLNLFAPGDVHAFTWVYLILHLFWAISSLTLLTNARQKYVRYINIFLYIWIILTLIISVLDLALGILFAIDYDTLVRALFEYTIINPAIVPTSQVYQQMFVLSSAVHVAGIMMVMAFRGWIFWIVNVTLAIYMFTQTFKIYDYNQMRRKTNGATNGGYMPESDGPRRAPIDAYDMNRTAANSFGAPEEMEYRRPVDRVRERPIEVETPVPPQMLSWSQQQQQQQYQQQQQQQQPRSFEPKPNVIVNRSMEPLAGRAQSPEASVIEERQPDTRPIPPPPPPKNFMNTVVRRDAAAAKVAQELNYRNSFNVTNSGIGAVNLRPTGINLLNPGPSSNGDDLPTPNYSPPMPRLNPFENRPPLRSVLRNSRFQ